jgi:uncharacterized protein (DUF433 family)
MLVSGEFPCNADMRIAFTQEVSSRRTGKTTMAVSEATRRGDDMSAIDRITMTPDVCGGRPCIRGLRIRLKDVLDLLAAGATREEILADYPYLEAEDITAVLEFAARQNDHPVLRSA